MKYTGKKEKLIYFWHVSVYMYTLYTLQYSDVYSFNRQPTDCVLTKLFLEIDQSLLDNQPLQTEYSEFK